MPSTAVGLGLFVALLAPGLAYVAARESRFPKRDASTFRESGEVAVVSLACDLGAVALFAVVRAMVPDRVFDVGRLIREGGPYATTHYRELTAWVVAALVVATAGGWLLGRYLPRIIGEIDPTSAWWAALHSDERVAESFVYVGCELTGGGHIHGLLRRISVDPADTLDRDITLEAPLSYTPPGGDEDTPLDASSVLISAHRIEFVTVKYTTMTPERVEHIRTQ